MVAKGSTKNMDSWLKRMTAREQFKALEKYGQIGVNALSRATPEDSGLAAESWSYEIEDRPGIFAIHWTNSDVENGFHVAVMLQYGHGTGTGGYVEGRDYINPAMRPVFDRMVEEMWRVVTK